MTHTHYANSSTSYNLNGLLPQHWLDWDSYTHRLGRYDVLSGYYHNVAYHSITSYSESLKFVERLYKHVRGVYNPSARLVEAYVNKIYGGILDTRDAERGAIPIATDNDALKTAIIALWKASRWGQKKSLYVRNGAMFGDTFLNIVDDIESGSVYLEPVDPRKVKLLETDSTGKITEIIYEYFVNIDNSQRKFKFVITEDTFATFIDGSPYEMYTNGRGEQVSQWDNEYGFVPVAHVPHRDVGMMYGGNAYYTSMHKINELNDLASIQNDGARRQVNMPLFGFGLGNASGGTNNIDYGRDQSTSQRNRDDRPRKDTQRMLNFDKDGRIEAKAPVLDLSSSLSLILEILAEIERDLPELSLHRIRDSGNATAPGVRSAYDDAISRFQEARGNYDSGLVEAQKMAVAIGGMRGYDGYQGFNLMSLERGNLEHYIEQRPVISETLSKSEQIQLTLQAMSLNAPRSVYAKMEWGEDAIEEILVAQEQATSSFINGFTPPTDESPIEAPDVASANDAAATVNSADLLEVDRLLTA